MDTGAGAKSLSDLLHDLRDEHAAKHPGGKLLTLDIAVQTESGHVLRTDSAPDVSLIVKSGDDLLLGAAEVARKTDNTRPSASGVAGKRDRREQACCRRQELLLLEAAGSSVRSGAEEDGEGSGGSR